jgi:hypothetical protein
MNQETEKTENTNNDDQKKINRKKLLAKVAIMPPMNAAAIIAEYGNPFGEQDVTELSEALSESTNKIVNGDMKECQRILLSQAYSLQSIFMNLSRRATNQEYIKNYETYLRLALKAQSQCRTTLETLAIIKNPPLVFARQANISNGHQQINNLSPQPTDNNSSRAEKNKSEQNELLEKHDEQWLEQRTAGAASNQYPELDPLEKINRSEN